MERSRQVVGGLVLIVAGAVYVVAGTGPQPLTLEPTRTSMPQNVSYTVSAELPSVPERLPVYAKGSMPFSQEQFVAMGKRLGIGSNVVQGYEQGEKRMYGNGTSLLFSEWHLKYQPSFSRRPKDLPSDQVAKQAARRFLQRHGLLFDTARFEDVVKGGFVESVNTSSGETLSRHATYKAVNYGRTLQGYPIKGMHGIHVLIGENASIIGAAIDWPTFDRTGTVAVKQPQQAITQLRQGDAIVGRIDCADVTITDVSLTYWNSAANDERVEPVYRFTGTCAGEQGFVATLPARAS
ncbi:MAG: hypothetical protein SV186_06445 [Candidatus Nanohaloarchaea archaeon]|nr:hypothetical protein [Candidatus Nanohaloarchaea archaeon]